MSFHIPVNGTIDGGADYGVALATRPRDEWVTAIPNGCPISTGELIDCPKPGFVELTVTASTADAILNGLTDPYDFSTHRFYTVAVNVDGPNRFFGGYNGCSIDFGSANYPCGDLLDSAMHMDVTGSFVDLITGAPVATTLYEGGGDPCRLNGGDSSLLVNPDPIWPSPDGAGNTAGSVLFRREQLPVSVSATIGVHNAGYSDLINLPGRVRLEVNPFEYDPDVPRSGSGSMCVL